jgi:hypothetical protein
LPRTPDTVTDGGDGEGEGLGVYNAFPRDRKLGLEARATVTPMTTPRRGNATIFINRIAAARRARFMAAGF